MEEKKRVVLTEVCAEYSERSNRYVEWAEWVRKTKKVACKEIARNAKGMWESTASSNRRCSNSSCLPICELLLWDDSVGYFRIKEYIEQGYTRAVVLDLSKYFDTLNHTILSNLLRKQVKDERVIQMVKWCLKSRVMENGVVTETEEGST